MYCLTYAIRFKHQMPGSLLLALSNLLCNFKSMVASHYIMWCMQSVVQTCMHAFIYASEHSHRFGISRATRLPSAIVSRNGLLWNKRRQPCEGQEKSRPHMKSPGRGQRLQWERFLSERVTECKQPMHCWSRCSQQPRGKCNPVSKCLHIPRVLALISSH